MKKSRKNIIKLFTFLILLTIFAAFATDAVYAIDWWDKATNWYDGQTTASTGISSSVLSGIAETVEIIGTGVIAIATVVIGIKYVFGTVQGKADAKENLITLLVACLFFFGWSNIRDLLIVGNATATGGISGSTKLIFFQGGDIKASFAQIFTLLVTIGKFLCVLAILFMGVKYVLSGANARAQLKEKGPAIIIGTILIFCTVSVLGAIADIIDKTV